MTVAGLFDDAKCQVVPPLSAKASTGTGRQWPDSLRQRTARRGTDGVVSREAGEAEAVKMVVVGPDGGLKKKVCRANRRTTRQSNRGRPM